MPNHCSGNFSSVVEIESVIGLVEGEIIMRC